MDRLQAFFTRTYYEAEEREARLDGDLEAARTAEEADQSVGPGGQSRRGGGEPFADASGALKGKLTESEIQALETWATKQALEGCVLLDDVNNLAAGTAIVRGG